MNNLIQKKRLLNSVLLVVAFTSCVFLIRWYKDTRVPVYVANKGLPNAITQGNPEDSMDRTRQLVSKLRELNFDYFKVPRSLYRLPDARFAEDEFMRTGRSVSFVIYDNAHFYQPMNNMVAVTTDIYVRRNTKVYKGEVSKSNMEGFYIVGWRDGRVTKVPVEDVRVVKHGDSIYEIFPGTPEWKKDGIRLSGIEFANGYNNARPEARAFFQPSSEECATCSKNKNT